MTDLIPRRKLPHIGGRAGASQPEAAADLRTEALACLMDGRQGFAIYMLDAAGQVTFWNSGAEHLTGWTEAEVSGAPVGMFYPADAVAAGKPREDIDRARAFGRFEDECWRLRKDGTEFLASVSWTALLDETGGLRGFANVIADVTEKRAAEEQLRAYESQLSAIWSTVPDAMVVIDQSGRMLSFSAGAEILFGYIEAEMVGRNISVLMPSPHRDRRDSIGRYLLTEEGRILGRGRTVVGQRSDGSQFPMELFVGEAVRGKERVFTSFIRDLTERQMAEQQMAMLQGELIHVTRVSAMGTMASTLAHELNQPIAAAANYIQAVCDQLADLSPSDLPMMREALGEAGSEVLRAGLIVRRLREFVSRGEIEKTIEYLPDLIREAAALGLVDTREMGVEVCFDLDAAALPVLVDKIQIQQVLINLFRNACDAMEQSTVRRLTVSARPQGRDLVRVTVSDTGCGIPPDLASQLFSAYVSTKAGGLGLGLSICRTIVEVNGGKIWTEFDDGPGTHFHFTLVRAPGDEPDEREETRSRR